MDTLDKMEELFASVEQHVFSSLAAMARGLPDVHEVADRLWIDISRYGPGLPAFPEVYLPSLGDFQIPPPPPPPPAPSASQWLEKWIGKHPGKTLGVFMSLVGVGLWAGYTVAQTRRKAPHRLRSQQLKSFARRQVVVVLGADSPLGQPLVLDLEKRGYIVIASVATPEAVESLEQQTQGYVKVLVLDPYEPLMIPAFLRSLNVTLSRKFPINSAGDPFAPLISHPYIHSIISLLTLPTSKTTQTLAPLEHISIPETYLPYLTATHITPLQVIQALLPLLRTGPALTHDHKLDKTVIVCLPALDVRVGLPFASVRSMSAAAMERGVEVLRREIRSAAGANGQGTQMMRNIQVVVVDVGVFDVGEHMVEEEEQVRTEMVRKIMGDWTASEQLCYGMAFTNTLRGCLKTPWEMFVAMFRGTERYSAPRTLTDVSVFVDNVVDVVSCGRGVYRGSELGLGLSRIRKWVRGERFSVGTGAQISKLASYLPWTVLDLVINIPHLLIGDGRNRLLMTQPSRNPSSSTPVMVSSVAASRSKTNTVPEHDDISSEADVESVSGDSGASGSWIDLNASHQPGGVQGEIST